MYPSNQRDSPLIPAARMFLARLIQSIRCTQFCFFAPVAGCSAARVLSAARTDPWKQQQERSKSQSSHTSGLTAAPSAGAQVLQSRSLVTFSCVIWPNSDEVLLLSNKKAPHEVLFCCSSLSERDELEQAGDPVLTPPSRSPGSSRP